MKDYLKSLVSATDPVRGVSVATEYCQARILQMLQDTGAFASWIFCGGTALRFLFELPRYSEDLDFAASSPDTDCDFRRRLEKVARALADEAYPVRLACNDDKTVRSAWLRFDGLPHELGLSPHPDQVLAVKVELDANPPAGGNATTSLVRRHVLLNLHHYDRPSLLAGKVHALLQRSYTKGRDLYDLLWYLSDRSWPAPNLPFLNDALRQTGWDGPELTEGNWARVLGERLESLDWLAAINDVRPFVERQQDLELLTKENIAHLLGHR